MSEQQAAVAQVAELSVATRDGVLHTPQQDLFLALMRNDEADDSSFCT